MRQTNRLALLWALWAVSGGCTGSAGGGGGAGGSANPQSVTNISRAINDVLTCMNAGTMQTDQQTTAELQATYGQIPAPKPTFPDFVTMAETSFADIQSTCMPIEMITDAQNRTFACIGVDTRVTTAQNFRDLRSGFLRSTGLMMSFSPVVDQFVTQQNMKADQICASAAGANPDLDALVTRLTTSANRRAGCINSTTRVTDADARQVLQSEYFVSAVSQTLLEFAQRYVPAYEAATDQRCNG